MLRAAAAQLSRRAAAQCRRGAGRARGARRCCGSEAASPLERATAALGRVAAAPREGGAAAQACEELVSAHAALLGDQAAWWAERAIAEEEEQLEALSKALPRGGRVAPRLLDAIAPVAPPPSEAALRRLVSSLGAARGLAAAVELRAAVRSALAEAGTESPAGYALERLDRRLKEVLALWLDPGLLRTVALSARCPAKALEAARAVGLEAAGAQAGPLPAEAIGAGWHRCFGLIHPQMDPEAAPLLVARASLAAALPGALAEAVAPTAQGTAQVAVLWALGSPPGSQAGGLQDLGLGRALRRSASELLREELRSSGGPKDPDVVALVPLRGFAPWIRANRAWDHLGLGQAQAESLRRAAQGPQSLGSGEVSFIDEDGDNIRFHIAQESGGGHSLQVEVGGAAARRVLKLVVADGGRALRFVAEPGPEALQVSVTEQVAAKGEPARVVHLAEACGLLAADLREPVLRLAYEFLTQRAAGSKHAAHPLAHFHLSGGGALNALHWRADESPPGLADALGVMASFVYRGSDVEAAAAAAYAEEGLDAATFTGGGAA